MLCTFSYFEILFFYFLVVRCEHKNVLPWSNTHRNVLPWINTHRNVLPWINTHRNVLPWINTHRNVLSWIFWATLWVVLELAFCVLRIFILILKLVLMGILCLPFIFVDHLYRTYMPNDIAFNLHIEFVFLLLIWLIIPCGILLLKIKDLLFLVITSLWHFAVFLWNGIKSVTNT